ncbi:MAG: radical SAM protein [Spirochaetia bacterium]|nr:radical SAM protein [Spirochaetia bacterium]
MDLSHKATRAAIGAGFELALNHAKKNPKDGISQVIDLFTKYYSSKNGAEKADAFRGMSKYMSDPNAKWAKYANHIFNSVDSKILKNMMLNLGYEGGYLGWNMSRKLCEKYDCNIPFAIVIDPTSACNLHCTGCWSSEYQKTTALSYDDLDSIIKQAVDLGTHFFLYTGGEPMMRKNDIVKLAKEHSDCIFHLFTNGTLIDQHFCDQARDCGNIILSLSLEGFKEENDFRRGEGCFDKVMAAMDLMKKNKLAFGTSICWTNKNYKTVISDEFIDMIIEHGCLWTWYFHFMPVGQDTDTTFLPTAEQRTFMFNAIRNLRNENNGKLIFPIDFQNDGEYIGGCIAGGKNYLHINSNGDVEPCVFIHYSSANIHKETLLEALQQPLFRAYKKAQPFNSNLYQPCPMLENPDRLPQMVKETGAVSTDLCDRESADHLCSKCVEYAKDWAPVADSLWKEHMEAKKKKAEGQK